MQTKVAFMKKFEFGKCMQQFSLGFFYHLPPKSVKIIIFRNMILPIVLYMGLYWSHMIKNFAVDQIPSCISVPGWTAHITRMTCSLLNQTFSDQQISREGPIMWPPSLNLTPLDFLLWWFTKNLLYHETVKNMQALREHVRNAVAQITPNMLENS